MFTGIIEAAAKIKDKTDSDITIDRPAEFDDIKIGSSICVSGVCLSVIEFDQNTIKFDVMPETLRKTKIGDLEVGDTVNLERALSVSDRFEGHIVQGHSEGVSEVVAITPQKTPSPNPSPKGRGEQGVIWEACKKIRPRNTLFFARRMRRKPTKAEKELWRYLRSHQLGFHFRRQYIIDGSIIDFYCHEVRLGIELDGSIHDSEEQIKNDQERSEHLEKEHEIKILRFKNNEVLENITSVLNKIKTELPSPLGGGDGGGGNNKQKQNDILLTIKIPKDLMPLIVPQGSISIDGVSLTVASVEGNLCTVALIPHTLKNSTLGDLNVGDAVNIETDVLSRYVLNRS